MAEERHVELHTHILAGHPVRDIVRRAADLHADLLIIGVTGHSGVYQRMIGSRADRRVQLVQCPVLVVNNLRQYSDIILTQKVAASLLTT
jgi:nucleotide-binding universal stress UspA family protein